jgi:GT2 family glycosyltransferase
MVVAGETAVTDDSPNGSPPSPRVCIVIVTWNQRQTTTDCLDTVLKMTYPDFEVILVDNGSTDDTVRYVTEHYPGVEVIAHPENLGFAVGSNIGIRRSLEKRCDYVFLLNNDTLVPHNLLDELISQAEHLPDAGVISPRITYADDPERVWFAGTRRNPLTLEARDIGPHGPRRTHATGTQTVGYVFGTAMLIRKEVLGIIGLFDETFFMYYEDMDFCLRAEAAGFRLYYVPAVTVRHRVATSTSQLSSMYYHCKARSSVWFFRKHGKGLRRLVIVPYRFGSALLTVARLGWRHEWSVAGAYLSGLVDGFNI